MPDPNRNRKSKHPPPRKGKKARGHSGRPQPKRKPKRKEIRAEAQAGNPEAERERNEPDVECRFPRLKRPLRWIRRHHIELGLFLALFAILAAFTGQVFLAVLFPAPKPPDAPGAVELVRFVPQVKRSGAATWANAAEMQDQDSRIVVGMRIENPASQPITGLVGRARLPAVFLPNGRCRYGINQLAITPCQGSPYVEGGIPLPALQSGDWLHLVFEAEVPADIPGSLYVIDLSVSSNQTGEIRKVAEVKVSTTVAEETVRDLFGQTESEEEFWEGKPEMAPRSKRLLIRRWPELALEKVHRVGEMPRGQLVSLADLFYDHTHEGRVVRLKGRITGPPSAFPNKSARVVKQSYEVGATGERPRLRCYTWRPADHLLRKGDELRIKVIPIAWSPQGGKDELTMGVCPAVRITRSSDRERGGS